MNRLLAAALAIAALTGCNSVREMYQPKDPYAKPMFYEKYLTTGEPIDARIQQTLEAVRNDPHSATLHNELGQLLRQKGFPKDAEREFERAVDDDSHFYPAWYNLGLIREANGNYPGAHFAFGRAIHYKPGHAAALFQMGLMEEKRRNTEAAVAYYAKAFSINHALLDVRVNPRVLDSKLIDLALIRLYPIEHARESLQFQPSPAPYVAPAQPQAPSPQPSADEIVPPAPPVTNPATQTPPPKPPE